MGFRSWILLVTLAFSSSAFAQGEAAPAPSSPAGFEGSEYMHQAPGGKIELSPQVGISTSRSERKTSNIKVNTVVFPLLVRGEYGFNDMFSMGAVWGSAFGVTSIEDCPTGSTCDDTKSRGFVDPSLYANVRIPLGAAALRIGTELSMSLEDAKEEADGDTNNASGGTTLDAFVGFEMPINRHTFGALAGYDIYKGDRDVKDESTTPASKYKFTDGEQLQVDAFYEYNFPEVISIGGALQYISSSESKTKTSTGSVGNKNGADIYSLIVYVPLRFNPRVTLVPVVSAGMTDYRSGTVTIKDQTHSSLSCMARFTF